MNPKPNETMKRSFEDFFQARISRNFIRKGKSFRIISRAPASKATPFAKKIFSIL